MPLYRVRRGYTFGAFDQHTAGALVELQEREALPFLDKLEPAEEEKGQPEPEGDKDPAGGAGDGEQQPAGEDGSSLDTVSSEGGEKKPKPKAAKAAKE